MPMLNPPPAGAGGPGWPKAAGAPGCPKDPPAENGIAGPACGGVDVAPNWNEGTVLALAPKSNPAEAEVAGIAGIAAGFVAAWFTNAAPKLDPDPVDG